MILIELFLDSGVKMESTTTAGKNYLEKMVQCDFLLGFNKNELEMLQ